MSHLKDKKSHKAKVKPWSLLVTMGFGKDRYLVLYGPFESYLHARTWANKKGYASTSLALELEDPEKPN